MSFSYSSSIILLKAPRFVIFFFLLSSLKKEDKVWECKNVMCEMFVFMKSSAYVNSLAGLCTCVRACVSACVRIWSRVTVLRAALHTRTEQSSSWPAVPLAASSMSSLLFSPSLSVHPSCLTLFSFHFSNPFFLSFWPFFFNHYLCLNTVTQCPCPSVTLSVHHHLSSLFTFLALIDAPPFCFLTFSQPVLFSQFFLPHLFITTKALWTKLLSSCFTEWVNITAARPLDFFLLCVFLSFPRFFPPFPLR